MTFFEYMEITKDAVLSTMKGMAITLNVFTRVQSEGTVTKQYPEEKDQIPLGSRGLLFNDEEDCISCRQCANVCPVDCIYIEADKKEAGAPEDLTKGGVKKTLNLVRFEIDKSLCCYCGLCSAACPTECLYHTKEYEYSVMERDKHIMDYKNYHR